MSEQSSIYINILTDFGFRYVFGREDHKQFFLSFINSLRIGENVSEITSVEFSDNDKPEKSKETKALINDARCVTSDGKKIIVDIQNRYQARFKDRALYYLSGNLHNQGIKGYEWDHRLTPVYGVFLMDFGWKEGDEELLREDIALINKRTNEVFSEKLNMTFLKISVMSKKPEECSDLLERWLYIMKHMEKMSAMPEAFMKDPIFKQLDAVARVSVLSEADRRAYEASLKSYRDNYSVGRTERDEGRKEGREEGIEEGIELGVMKTLRQFLSAGLDISFISKTTGIPVNRLNEIKASL